MWSSDAAVWWWKRLILQVFEVLWSFTIVMGEDWKHKQDCK